MTPTLTNFNPRREELTTVILCPVAVTPIVKDTP